MTILKKVHVIYVALKICVGIFLFSDSSLPIFIMKFKRNSTEFMIKFVKNWYLNPLPPALCDKDKASKGNIKLIPKSCFSHLSDFVEFYRILQNASSKG